MAETTTRKLTFDDHRRELADFKYVYPVLSRRAAGISVGINLNPDKGCNFDCVYCQVDRTGVRPKPGVDLHDLRDELIRLFTWIKDGSLFERPPFDTAPEAMRVVRDLSFSGDGEPTAFPRFKQCVALTIETLDQLGFEDLSINVITNATLFHKPGVREALALLDAHKSEIWAKLDAGTEAYYHRVDITKVPFDRVLDNLKVAAQLRPIVIQSLFVKLDGQGPDAAEIDAYIGRLVDIDAAGGQLKNIQVHTVARRPPSSRVRALGDAVLDDIVTKINAALPDIPAKAYYGSAQFMD